MPIQFKIAPVDKNDSVLDFKAHIVGVVDAASEIAKITYNSKVMTVSSDVGARTRRRWLFLWWQEIFCLVLILHHTHSHAYANYILKFQF